MQFWLPMGWERNLPLSGWLDAEQTNELAFFIDFERKKNFSWKFLFLFLSNFFNLFSNGSLLFVENILHLSNDGICFAPVPPFKEDNALSITKLLAFLIALPAVADPGTLAARRYEDDIDLVTKKRRLQEIVDVQWTLSNESNKRDVGSVFEVLIEGNSKRNEAEWMGRNSQNKVVVFPKGNFNYQKGDYAQVKIQDFTKGTLLGRIV